MSQCHPLGTVRDLVGVAESYHGVRDIESDAYLLRGIRCLGLLHHSSKVVIIARSLKLKVIVSVIL